MKTDKNVIDMTDYEILEAYNLFGIKSSIALEDEFPKDGCPLFFYKKCSILKDNGVQYSNYTSQETQQCQTGIRY
jgi:hypothetical protein